MTMLSLLPLAKVLLAFCAMLLGIRFRVGLFLSILGGSLLMGLAFGLGPITWVKTGLKGVFQEQSLFLAAIVALILVLSDLLDRCGQAGRLLQALGARIRNPRLSLAFFPALIGLLPMPGGAVFSAPMVRTMAERVPGKDGNACVGPADQSLINYWYRHVWELAWPLYPGVILAASLSGIPLVQLALILSPAPVVALLAGWWFILRPATADIDVQAHACAQAAQDVDSSWGTILREGLPLTVAIGGAILLEVGIALLTPDLAFEWGVLAALALAIVCTTVQNRTPLKEVLALFGRKHLLSMLSVVAAIYVFKEVLQDSGAIHQIAESMGGGAALFAAGVFLPFFVGAVSGLNIAFVGASFPLILGLLQQTGHWGQLWAYVVLGMFAGYAGVMASPLHLCFILTCQFFQVELSQAWRRILPPCACIVATGILYFLVLRVWS